MTGEDAATLAFYEAEAPVYGASGAQGASGHLPRFLAALSPGARILELGCGGGRDAEAMIAAGCDVDATDGCAALAELAAERIGGRVRMMRFAQFGRRSTSPGAREAAMTASLPTGSR